MSIFRIPDGALTALITPFTRDQDIDMDGFDRLIDFQISQGISGIVPVGTTGESPTLNEVEHGTLIKSTVGRKDIFVLAGCGSNCTAEALHYAEVAVRFGGIAGLFVDPYYNGPSSLEIRKEYYEHIAGEFRNFMVVPYIIKGRTGCELLPADLAILNREFPNVCSVKEASGDLERMEETRSLAPDLQIVSGDDDKTFTMMIRRTINASGVVSVISNIAAAAVQKMCQAILHHDNATAEKLREQLEPLFKVVTVPAPREVFINGCGRTIIDKFRNPLGIKTMMNGLGMPAGPCRQPLGKMTPSGVKIVRDALSTVWSASPEILRPIEGFFKVNIGERLADDKLWASLAYQNF